jgi:hypothetical protein
MIVLGRSYGCEVIRVPIKKKTFKSSILFFEHAGDSLISSGCSSAAPIHKKKKWSLRMQGRKCRLLRPAEVLSVICQGPYVDLVYASTRVAQGCLQPNICGLLIRCRSLHRKGLYGCLEIGSIQRCRMNKSIVLMSRRLSYQAGNSKHVVFHVMAQPFGPSGPWLKKGLIQPVGEI